MIRTFVFSKGKLVGQDLGLDLLRSVLYDEDAQIWADLDQPTPEEVKNLLELVFSFHPLAIEDCMTVSEQPKIDEYESYLFLVLHAVDFLHSEHEFRSTELNLFIGKNFLVTVHRQPLRSINATIDRIMKNSTAVAKAPDRLTYTLLDFLLDNYDPAIEELSSEIAALEHEVLTEPSRSIMADILKLKSEVQRLRQIISPQRDVIARLARGEFKLVRVALLPYYRDLLDRLLRFTEKSDNYRDSLTSIMQVHLNLQQNQTNRVMKVLTVLATLSMPMVMVTSFYGMNFTHMPELHLPYAHLYVFALTFVTTAIIYVVLRRKKWL